MTDSATTADRKKNKHYSKHDRLLNTSTDLVNFKNSNNNKKKGVEMQSKFDSARQSM